MTSKRLLVVNPNTSQEVTGAFLAAARAIAPHDVTMTGVTGRFGARIVSMEAENVIAGHSALDLVAHHAQGFDGVILAISFDTGLDALRSVLPMPVVGITQAALRQAQTGGRRLGVVFFGEVSRGLYEAVLGRNGIVPNGIVCVDVGDASDYLSPGAKDEAVRDACVHLEATGAEAVVIFGAAIVGMAARLAPQLPLPVYDGTEAVQACLDAIASASASRAPKPLPLGDSVGLSAPLASLLRGKLT